MIQYKIICNKIIKNITNINELQYLKFRDILYDIFIYNLDISHCIWYILSSLIQENKIKKENISDVLIKTYHFFQYYNGIEVQSQWFDGDYLLGFTRFED